LRLTIKPHILEALELPAAPGRASRWIRQSLPRRSARRWPASSIDAILIDLNYTRDTTSGQEASICFPKSVALDSNIRSSS